MLPSAGIIIPPIPEKNVVQKYQQTAGFLAKRRAALEKFINRVVSWALVVCPHPSPFPKIQCCTF